MLLAGCNSVDEIRKKGDLWESSPLLASILSTFAWNLVENVIKIDKYLLYNCQIWESN